MQRLREIGDGAYLVAIRTAGSQQRDAARTHIRYAAREALAQVLGIAIEQIQVRSTPGEPPALVWSAADSLQERVVCCSFSHDDGLSLAAFNLRGAVGVDVIRVVDIPDWERVAQDYLGRAATEKLRAASPAERPHAFAQAWAEHEARLKCLGLQLAEWETLPPAARDGGLRMLALELPENLVGALAFSPTV